MELKENDRGTSVFYLQLALRRAGIPVALDGIYGERTCAAVAAYFGRGDGCAVSGDDFAYLLPYLKGYREYTVRAGDTLWGIAASVGSAVDRILHANPGVAPENLRVGERLIVPYDFALVPTDVPYSSDLVAWIVEGLKKRYPFLGTGSIGKSVMGTKIAYLRIGADEKSGRQVFYNAAFHANEWITIPVVLKFAEEYLKAYAYGRTIGGISAARLFEETTLFLVPLVNPDGVDLVNGEIDKTSYLQQAERIAGDYPDIAFPDGWKANIAGIDLNLQFPAGWENARETKFAQGYTSPAPRDYVGSGPLTAPESRAVYEFTREHDFGLVLAYHTQGEIIYWKYLDYEPENSYGIAKYFSDVSGYAVEETPAASGYAGYKDWFIKEYDRPGYTIEAGLGKNPLPLSQFPQIYKDNFGILLGGLVKE